MTPSLSSRTTIVAALLEVLESQDLKASLSEVQESCCTDRCTTDSAVVAQLIALLRELPISADQKAILLMKIFAKEAGDRPSAFPTDRNTGQIPRVIR